MYIKDEWNVFLSIFFIVNCFVCVLYFWCNVSVELRTKHIMRNQVSYLKEIGDGWFGKVTPGSKTRSLHKSALELCICLIEGRSGRRC